MKKMMFKIVAVTEVLGKTNIPVMVSSLLNRLENNSRDYISLKKNLDSIFSLKQLNIEEASYYVLAVLSLKVFSGGKEIDFGLTRMNTLISFLNIVKQENAQRDKTYSEFKHCLSAFGRILKKDVSEKLETLFSAAITSKTDSGFCPSPALSNLSLNSEVEEFGFQGLAVSEETVSAETILKKAIDKNFLKKFSDSDNVQIKKNVDDLLKEYMPENVEKYVLFVLNPDLGITNEDKKNALDNYHGIDWRVKKEVSSAFFAMQTIDAFIDSCFKPPFSLPESMRNSTTSSGISSPILDLSGEPNGTVRYRPVIGADGDGYLDVLPNTSSLDDALSNASTDSKACKQAIVAAIKDAFKGSAEDKKVKKQAIVDSLQNADKNVSNILDQILKNNFRLFFGHSKFKAQLRSVCDTFQVSSNRGPLNTNRVMTFEEVMADSSPPPGWGNDKAVLY